MKEIIFTNDYGKRCHAEVVTEKPNGDLRFEGRIDDYNIYSTARTSTQWTYIAIKEVRMTEPWMVRFYNELDADFGYDCGPSTYMLGLEPAVAKSIARHKNKTTPDFISYFAEEEPQRFW